MREVVVQAWCDNEHDERRLATAERTDTLAGEAYLLDLCDACAAAYDRDRGRLDVWLAKGVPSKPAKKPPRPKQTENTRNARTSDFETVFMRTCQEPGCVALRSGKGYAAGERYVGPTRSALGQHVTQQHGKLLSDYDWSQPA